MGGLAFHAAEYLAIALDARDRAAEARRLDKTVMAPDALVSIVMAAVATEAFINELGAYYGSVALYLNPSEAASGTVLTELERGSTEVKYLAVSLTLGGRMFDRSSQPFQNFSVLMKVRNDLVHPRPLDRFEHAEDMAVMVPRPAYILDFEQKGITYEREEGVSVSWLNLLETEHVASWACRAAVDIIIAVVKMTRPNSALSTYGRAFSEHYGPRAHSSC